MLLKTFSAALAGIEARIVDVEVHYRAAGRLRYHVLGLPDAAVREGSRRVRAALENSGFRPPTSGSVTVNLAPADVRKQGSCFDLPIALALLGLAGLVPGEDLAGWLILGELSLDGRVRPVRGSLPVALSARRQGFRRLLVPADNQGEAQLVRGLDIYPADSLHQVVALLADPDRRPQSRRTRREQRGDLPDLRDVRGQATARRALEVACAGGHNLLLVGPPGSGKTMLARRIPSLLPPLDSEQILESTVIHSVCGQLSGSSRLLTHPPFRAPHHTVSTAGLAGGGPGPRPGEASLAHHGVLFLDELPEFARSSLEVLRQPLESREITISRARGSLTFPASFMLVAAMNPCPCGFHGSAQTCLCTPSQVQRYRSRVSGPLLDRIDLQVEVPRVELRELRATRPAEDSASVAARIRTARRLQQSRYRKIAARCNADLDSAAVGRQCSLSETVQLDFESKLERLGLSARAYHRILRVARTIADLAGATEIEPAYLAEAARYRSLDRMERFV